MILMIQNNTRAAENVNLEVVKLRQELDNNKLKYHAEYRVF